MAYAADPYSNAKKLRDAAAQAQDPDPSTYVTGVSLATPQGGVTNSATSGQAVAPGASTGTANGMGGTGYVNLSDYVNQNKATSNNMANALATPAASMAQNAAGAITNLQQQWAPAVNAGTVNYATPELQTTKAFNPYWMTGGKAPAAPVSATAGNATPAAASNGIGQRGFNYDTFGSAYNAYVAPGGQAEQVAGIRAAADPAAIAAATRTAGATYTGPNSLVDLAGYQNTANQTAAATTRLQALQSPAAVGNLLGTQYGGGAQYANSKGADLDSFLTRQTGQQHFDALNRQYSGLSTQLQNATNNTALADKAKANSALASGAAQAFLSGEDANTKARNDTQAQIDTRAKQDHTNDERAQEYDKYQAYWKSYLNNPYTHSFTPDPNQGKGGLGYDQWLKWKYGPNANVDGSPTQ